MSPEGVGLQSGCFLEFEAPAEQQMEAVAKRTL